METCWLEHCHQLSFNYLVKSSQFRSYSWNYHIGPDDNCWRNSLSINRLRSIKFALSIHCRSMTWSKGEYETRNIDWNIFPSISHQDLTAWYWYSFCHVPLVNFIAEKQSINASGRSTAYQSAVPVIRPPLWKWAFFAAAINQTRATIVIVTTSPTGKMKDLNDQVAAE